MDKYEIITLWATLDNEGMYIHVSRVKEEVEEWLEKDEEAMQITDGFGIIDKSTNIMPDVAADFHYDLNSALNELKVLNQTYRH